MSIDFWENNTKVVDQLGFEGRIIATRRERQLLADGKKKYVDVRGNDGLRRNKRADQLTEVIKVLPMSDEEKGELLGAIISTLKFQAEQEGKQFDFGDTWLSLAFLDDEELKQLAKLAGC